MAGGSASKPVEISKHENYVKLYKKVAFNFPQIYTFLPFWKLLLVDIKLTIWNLNESFRYLILHNFCIILLEPEAANCLHGIPEAPRLWAFSEVTPPIIGGRGSEQKKPRNPQRNVNNVLLPLVRERP
jgi:hypothetical protein